MPVDDEELSDLKARLYAESGRRGVQSHSLTSRKVRRSAAESRALDEFCIWLARCEFNVFFSVTYSDTIAELRGIRSIRRARGHVLKTFSELGYRGRLGLGVEMTDRDVPHVHGVLHGDSDELPRLLGAESPRDGLLWRFFHSECGRCRFELIRDLDEATLYALKDTFKESSSDEALYIRLRPQVGRRNARRQDVSEQEAIYTSRRYQRRRAAAVVEQAIA